MAYACKWDAVKELGAYLGLSVGEESFKRLSSGPDSGESLAIVCRQAGVFSEAYPSDVADLIVGVIFDTDFSTLSGGDREDALSRDVFRRVSGRLGAAAGGAPGDDAYPGFVMPFRRFARGFKAALTAVLCARGLRKEEISLDNPGVRQYLSELRELPCRRLGELSFAHRVPGDTAMAKGLEALLKKYEGRLIPEENCRSIMEVMGRVSGFPGYYRTMDAGQKLVEARPLLLAISALQLDPAKAPEKASLLSTLGILLFNIFPTAKLLKLVARLAPDPADDALSHEYFAILSMSHLLAGRPDEATAYNEKAFGHAMDEERRAYTHILESCIRLHRRDFNGAVNALCRCASTTRDKRMRAVAQFYLGIVYYEMGRTAEAYECFQQADAGLDDELDSMNVYNNVGICALAQGDPGAAAKAFEHVEYASRYMGSNTAKALKAVACGSLGIIYFNRGDYDRSAGYFKEALKLARDAHDKKRAADQLGNIGLSLKHKKDHGLALEYFRSALNVSFACDYAEGVLFSFSQIEQLMALEGRFGDAERLKNDMIRQNPDIARMLRR